MSESTAIIVILGIAILVFIAFDFPTTATKSPTRLPPKSPPADPPPDVANHWRGKVLGNGSSNTLIVPAILPDGRLIDAKCKSGWQWSVVTTGSKVFGSIDSDGNYIVEGIVT